MSFFERCDHTGLWKLTLDDYNEAQHQQPPVNKAINVIFDLPSARQSFLWYHAAGSFPTRETFIRAIRNGNYATWPNLGTCLTWMKLPNDTSRANAKASARQNKKFLQL
jgi:hypothetical protein